MSEKYIDLIHAIEDSDSMTGCERVTVEAVLAWLDFHPDQAPGRTITESEVERLFDMTRTATSDERLREIGLTIVDNPEPTNAEKIGQLIARWRDEGKPWTLDAYLDKAGVTAPGGDDGH